MTVAAIEKPRIIILASGSGSNLQRLIEVSRERDFPGEIVAVGSNRPNAFALERAAQASIETFVVDHTRYSERAEYDGYLRAELERRSPDLVVLAGYMRIMTPDLVNAFRGRMLNVHPSLLPKYPGLNTHARALEAGDAEHGVTIHFVTEDLDGGPVIAQASIGINPDDTVDSLTERVQEREHQLYPIIVRWFCEGRIQLKDDTVTFDGQPMPSPFFLPADA